MNYQSRLLYRNKFFIRRLLSDTSKNRIFKLLGTGPVIGDDYIRKNCLFIHIPKTGGLSIHNAISGNSIGFGHHSASTFAYLYSDFFKTAFKFCIVRNPYQRLLSAYNFLIRGGNNDYCKWFNETYLKKYGSFEKFVLELNDSRELQQWIHFIPQCDFITDHNGELLVDYVGRFESLNNDYSFLMKELNLSQELEHTNKSANTDQFMQYFTSDMKLVVHKLYEQDFILLDYSKSD